MTRNLRGTTVVFLITGIILLVLYFLPENHLPIQSTMTPEFILKSTITATSTNTFVVGQIILDTPCHFGTSNEYEIVTTISQGTGVVLIGKNSDQSRWLLIRWGGLTDCWVEKKFVSTSFDIALLPVVPTPPEPTLAPTQTKVVGTNTPSPTATEAVLGIGYINKGVASTWTEPNGTLIERLTLNQPLTILEVKVVAGSTWYRCRWDSNGITWEGWVLAEYITFGNPPP